MLRTFHSLDMLQVDSKKDSTKRLSNHKSVWYDGSMGGVDRSNQSLSYYSVARINKRNTIKKIFRFLVNQSLNSNSYVINKKNKGDFKPCNFHLQLNERKVYRKEVCSHLTNIVKISENVT